MSESTRSTLTDVERDGILHAVEAQPELFIEALELRTCHMVEAFKRGDDETELLALGEFVSRVKKAKAGR